VAALDDDVARALRYVSCVISRNVFVVVWEVNECCDLLLAMAKITFWICGMMIVFATTQRSMTYYFD
jgi:predicted transcriptional regulator